MHRYIFAVGVNATFPLVAKEISIETLYQSGHGGPDPGAIGIYQGRQLHEDEYAYDIILRTGLG